MQVAPRDRTTNTDISDIYVRARSGEMVQLSNLLGVREGVSPQSLNHFNRIHVCPPLTTPDDEVRMGIAILDEALAEADKYVV